MASSGSYNMTSGYGTIRVDWWVISQSTSGNYTRVGWRAVATWASNTWLQVYSCNIWINGAQVLARGSAQTWGGQFASGEINIGHNSDGTKQFGSNGNAAIYTAATNATGSGVWDLPTIARWASLTAISMDSGGIPATDESALWLEFSNPAGVSVTAFVEIIVGGSIVGGRVFQQSGVGSRHNFPVNSTSTALIQSKMPNTATATIRIGIYSTVSGTTQYDYRDRTITIANGSGQANPVFTDFSYKDSNPVTVAITGNDQYIIQGHSTLQATILAADKMVAQKLATPSSYRYQIGSIDVTEPYAETDVVKELGTVGVNTSTPLVVTARDSRNLGKAVSETVFIVPYLSPQLSGTAQRVNNFETSTKISITGVISRLTIGGTDKNAVNTTSGLQYRYKKTDTATWGAWQNITSSTSGANVSMTDFYVNLDRNFAWNVEFRLTDKITNTVVALVVSVGIPIFRIGTDGKTYNNEQPLSPSHVGQIMISTTLDTPEKMAEAFGGTWVRWALGRSIIGIGNNGSTNYTVVEQDVGSDNVTLTTQQMPSHGHATGRYDGLWVNNMGVVGGSAAQALIANTTNSGYRLSGTEAGGGQSHENRPASKTAYIYKRSV